MPVLSIVAIRVSLGFLCFGALTGVGIAVCRVGAPQYLAALIQIHWPLLVLGWLIQFTFGVAFWMFPKFGTERPRGKFVAAGLILLNVGCLALASGAARIFWAMAAAGVAVCIFGVASRIKPHLGRP